MTSCPEEFETNPLFKAANGTGDRVKVSAKHLDVVIACYAEAEPNLSRPLIHSLQRGKDGRVDRHVLFRLLNEHAKLHTPHKPLADPRCNCAVCVKARGARILKGDAPTQLTVAGMETVEEKVAAAKARTAKPKTEPDDFAMTMKGYFGSGSQLDIEKMFEKLCKENGIKPDKYAGRNFGLQRMALGNELRNRIKKGEPVRVGGKELK